MIAQGVDLVGIFSLLLRENLPNVPKIHLQKFINPMTTNVVAIHKALNFKENKEYISLLSNSEAQ